MAHVWRTDSGTVCVRNINAVTGDTVLREFWAPEAGGAVRSVSLQRPGTLGSEACRGLAEHGVTLWSTRAGLLDLIRREHRATQRMEIEGPSL